MNDNDLRWQLRQLPRDIEPGRDLWPDIAARLPATRKTTRRAPAGWLGGLALAASLCLAIGLAWRMQPAPTSPSAPLSGETEAMVQEFQQALLQLDGNALPSALRGDLATLDQSADSIRAALRADPESMFLLEQLRRTYALRLSLTQRALAG